MPFHASTQCKPERSDRQQIVKSSLAKQLSKDLVQFLAGT
jgi:hypothetical protein